MCALINMKAISATTFGELFSTILALLMIVLAIVIPVIIVIKIRANFYELALAKI